MKYIINRQTGKKLTYEEGYQLVKKLSTFLNKDDILFIKSVSFPSEKLAKQSAKSIVKERANYILGFSGIDSHKEGYNAIVIMFKVLPKNFEIIFQNNVILGD